VIAVSFLPLLTLEAQEDRLFKPLAYTKSLAMIVAAVLAITLDPALHLLFTRVRRLISVPYGYRGRPAPCWWAGFIPNRNTRSAARSSAGTNRWCVFPCAASAW
jgi:multidrug efflux pump subunit AcrB